MWLHHAKLADSLGFGTAAVLDGGRALGSNFGLSAGRPLAGTYRGQVAQLVEQRIENPRVDGSIPSLATTSNSMICKLVLASPADYRELGRSRADRAVLCRRGPRERR